MNRQASDEGHITNKYLKKCSVFLAVREKQSQMPLRMWGRELIHTAGGTELLATVEVSVEVP